MRHSIFVGVVVAALFFVGCGDSGGGATGVLTGASPVGTWKIDRTLSEPLIDKAMSENPQIAQAKEMIAGLPEAQRDQAQKMMDERMETEMKNMWSMFDKMRVTLSEDGTFKAVMPGEDEPKTGTWSIDGEDVTITPKKEEGDEEGDDDEIPIVKFRDGKLHLTSPNPAMPISFIMERAD